MKLGAIKTAGTMDARLFEPGRRVRVKPGACSNPRFDAVGSVGTLGKPRGFGRFQVQLDNGMSLNLEGRWLEFINE